MWVGVETGVAIMEISVGVTHEVRNRLATRSTCRTFRLIHRGLDILLKR